MHRTLLLGDVHFCSDQDEAVCEQYMQQAAAGLIYLHDRHIVHFDIKLENMLLHQKVIKLCDFGYLLPPSPPKNLPSSNFPLPADVYGVRINCPGTGCRESMGASGEASHTEQVYICHPS